MFGARSLHVQFIYFFRYLTFPVSCTFVLSEGTFSPSLLIRMLVHLLGKFGRFGEVGMGKW